MRKLFIIFFIPSLLIGCKESQEIINADKWKHAEMLEMQRRINQDNLSSKETIEKFTQKHLQIMRDNLLKFAEPVIKFGLTVLGIIFLIWRGISLFWRWSTQKILDETLRQEMKEKQITLREKNQAALKYIFDPIIFKMLEKSERKLIFEGLSNDKVKLENNPINEDV